MLVDTEGAAEEVDVAVVGVGRAGDVQLIAGVDLDRAGGGVVECGVDAAVALEGAVVV